MDTGPVFGTVTEKIADDDTAGSLLARLASSGAGLLAATLDGIADGSLDAVPQPAEGVSIAPKVTVDDARIRWTDPPLAIDRLVRSVTPAPGAWTEFRDQRVKIGPVTTTGFDDLPPGELRVEKRRVLVGTAGAPVALGTVQPAGKPAMPAVDWTRGAQPGSGERFT
jgi:methionyl-tRNA formyltransferase